MINISFSHFFTTLYIFVVAISRLRYPAGYERQCSFVMDCSEYLESLPSDDFI